MKRLNCSVSTCLMATAVLYFSHPSFAQVSVDPSNRYYRNAAGQPVFLMGYYAWAAVPDGFFIDHPSRYADMINQDAPYKLNYIRISLGVNRLTSSTTPPSWNGQPTPVPFLYTGNPAKADLNQWDNTFWTGLRNQCSLAQSNGMIVHVSFFDGVEIRTQGGESYGYNNSFWRPANQSATFYSNPDFNGNGQIDDSGEFYQTANFNNDTGIGHFQRLLIAKAISETSTFNNVFYEVANELLASDATWYTAVIAYAKTLTSRPVTQENNFVCGSTSCGRTNNLNGWSEHVADTPAQVKSNVAAIVGAGVPAWEDPDGPALSDSNVSPDDLRRAAWYSFAGGAAGWGGFTVDFWAGGTFNPTKTGYYRNLMNFITLGAVPFASMTPQHNLVSNNGENSMLAQGGSQYAAYILNDATATLTLTGISGQIRARIFDPRTGQYVAEQTLTGGGSPVFNKPAGADDWAIHVRAAGSSTSINLGTVDVPDGIMHPQVGDGDTVPATIGGRDARRNSTSADDFYFYFAVDDGWAFQGNKPNVNVTVDYYDTGTGTISLQYDSSSAAYTSGPSITLGNTNTWKQAVLNVTNAYFGNRQNNGADFRLFLGTSVTRYLDIVNVSTSASQSPFGGTPWAVPGIVQAENFDEGGETVAYHDLTAGNLGGQYRSTDVDVETTSDTGGGYNVGFIDTVEWYEYTVNVTSAGTYNINVRVASPNTGGTYHVEMNGSNVTGTKTVPNTGGWQTWTTSTSSNISLSSGQQVMRVFIDSGAWNFNYVDIQAAGGGNPYFTNSNFENGFSAAGGGYNGSVGTGWTPYTYTGVPSDFTFTDETNAANVNSGAHSQKIQAGAGKEGGLYNRFSVTNGNNYTVTVRAKSGSPTGWLWFGINTSGGTDAHEATGTFYPMENNRSTNWITFTWTGQATGNMITVFLDTYDGVGYWDTATPASPGGPVTISNSAFASSADGWNIVVWHSGPFLDGTMAFESGTGNPAGDMLSGGSGATNNTDNCNREGGEINKAISTSGYNTSIQVQYDLRFNTDQTGTACGGSCPTGVLEGNCADKIAVYYSTAGTGGPWSLLEAVNASTLTQNVWSTRTINCPAAANNKPNFALRFRFQFNTAPTDNGRLDNIKVIGTP